MAATPRLRRGSLRGGESRRRRGRDVSDKTRAPRRYISSFTDDPPLKDSPLKKHFETERTLLMEDLAKLKQGKKQRRVNEFIRRTRHAAHHARILAHLKSSTPAMGNKEAWEKRTLENLTLEFEKVAAKHRMDKQELPSPSEYQKVFKTNAVSLLKLPAGCDKHVRRADDGVAATHVARIFRFRRASRATLRRGSIRTYESRGRHRFRHSDIPFRRRRGRDAGIPRRRIATRIHQNRRASRATPRPATRIFQTRAPGTPRSCWTFWTWTLRTR